MSETWPPVLCRALLDTLRALRALANPGDSAEEDAVQLLELLPDAARKELVVNEGKMIGAPRHPNRALTLALTRALTLTSTLTLT